ncbi:MAG: hypothetical protein K6G81_10050 [Lachnospiraceae bacterium]|nr:hypothetical protein [Lachnospiraceae bacterium]
MKKSFMSEYFVFARKWRIAVMLLLLAIVCAVVFFMAGAFWQVSVLLAPSLAAAILCFMDYFAFCGFNSRKARGMELIKSSARGRKLISQAVRQDAVNKSIFSLAASVFALSCALAFADEEENRVFIILYAIAGFATYQAVSRGLLLIDRWKGLTMQVHILISYLGYSIGSVFLLPMIFLSESGSVPVMAAYAIVAEGLSVFMGITLVRSCEKAYDSSFIDT